MKGNFHCNLNCHLIKDTNIKMLIFFHYSLFLHTHTHTHTHKHTQNFLGQACNVLPERSNNKNNSKDKGKFNHSVYMELRRLGKQREVGGQFSQASSNIIFVCSLKVRK